MANLGNLLHFDAQQLSKQQIGGACKQAIAAYGYLPLLTNTNVGTSDTNAGLQSAVTTALSTRHADEKFFGPRINLGIQLGLYSTELSNARILGLTTTSGLVGLTFADNATIGGGSAPPE